jgi:uncharacterized membrane protein YidH (DUF202 family)
MALERSLMAWLRTSVALISFGFTIYKFMDALLEKGGVNINPQRPRNIGMFLVLLGMGLLVLGLFEYKTAKKQLIEGTGRQPPVSMGMLASVCILFLGIFVAADMFLGETYARIVDNMTERIGGPMRFRMYMQPAMAALCGILGGLKDAKAGRPPYFWAMFTREGYRTEMIRDGWKSIGKVFILAIVLDIIYQLIVERWIYPLETLIVAFVLAIVPYVVLRGLVRRVASRVFSLGSSLIKG